MVVNVSRLYPYLGSIRHSHLDITTYALERLGVLILVNLTPFTRNLEAKYLEGEVGEISYGQIIIMSKQNAEGLSAIIFVCISGNIHSYNDRDIQEVSLIPNCFSNLLQ